MNTGNRPQLPLASSGCSCCTPAGTAEQPTSQPARAAHQPSSAVGNSDGGASFQRDFRVEGMTCGHCVRSVETAVSAVAGVASASVDLVPGGRSRLTVKGSASDADVRQAVAAAGYSLA
ncbi:copper chaperone CopZ [Arthrobacter sp. SLBN-112]|uniref:heavy-metal-associated domain-containing protein n=1 Tax=Arthrobacter sp. SLBN-112 TaxID=2768452 RepID=UPI0011535E6B|nr:heavy-metal-associated domain-containing protein [Arthrobacter sp. SLBN-112]TQJ38205.1 copper chaperone CopZ [Arthrobacter sp. SLBN-112]